MRQNLKNKKWNSKNMVLSSAKIIFSSGEQKNFSNKLRNDVNFTRYDRKK